jgi:hypothetical protein
VERVFDDDDQVGKKYLKKIYSYSFSADCCSVGQAKSGAFQPRPGPMVQRVPPLLKKLWLLQFINKGM